MAKVTFAPEIESISGKLCRKSNTVLAVNKHTGKTYRYDSHPGVQPNSDDQKAVKALFTSKAKAAATWWNANKPSSSNNEGTADYKKVMAAYNKQFKVGNPYAYLRSLVDDDLKVNIPGATSTTPEDDGGL